MGIHKAWEAGHGVERGQLSQVKARGRSGRASGAGLHHVEKGTMCAGAGPVVRAWVCRVESEGSMSTELIKQLVHALKLNRESLSNWMEIADKEDERAYDWEAIKAADAALEAAEKVLKSAD